MQDNALWQYSLTVYSWSGVEPLLLQLQDEYQADVSIVLCCCWQAQMSVVLPEEFLLRLVNTSENWRTQCLHPLRSARRFLKTQAGSVELYQLAKNLELKAEQQQQSLLYNYVANEELPLSQKLAQSLVLINLHSYFNEVLNIYSENLDELLTQLCDRLTVSIQ